MVTRRVLLVPPGLVVTEIRIEDLSSAVAYCDEQIVRKTFLSQKLFCQPPSEMKDNKPMISANFANHIKFIYEK